MNAAAHRARPEESDTASVVAAWHAPRCDRPSMVVAATVVVAGPLPVPANSSVYPTLHPMETSVFSWCCPERPTVAEAWLSFIQDAWQRVRRGNLATETVRRYAELRSRLAELGDVSVAELRASQVKALHERLGAQRRRYSDGTLTRTADYLRDTLALVCDFAELMDWRAPGSNPVRKVRRFGSQVRQCRLEPGEFRQVLRGLVVVEQRQRRRRYADPLRNAAAGSAVMLIRCLCFWARRPKELVHLRWDQLDLDGPRPVARRVHTKRGVRAIAIPAPMVELLRIQRGRIGGLSPLVFPSGVGKTIKTLWQVWQEVLAVAGVRAFEMYGLRHNAATHLLEAGLTTKQVADYLCNTPEVVRKHYDHAVVSPEEDEAARLAGDIMAELGRGGCW